MTHEICGLMIAARVRHSHASVIRDDEIGLQMTSPD
jgi:hypothetical protein